MDVIACGKCSKRIVTKLYKVECVRQIQYNLGFDKSASLDELVIRVLGMTMTQQLVSEGYYNHNVIV